MPTLVVKNVPDALHQHLKARAARHRRSLTQETILLLEQGLSADARRQPVELPPPIRLKSGPVTTEWIEAAIAEDRD